MPGVTTHSAPDPHRIGFSAVVEVALGRRGSNMHCLSLEPRNDETGAQDSGLLRCRKSVGCACSYLGPTVVFRVALAVTTRF